MPNLKTYNSRSLVADIPSKWWNFVANFFNTVIGNGVAFTFTDSGKGCEVSTVGYTGAVWAQGETHSIPSALGIALIVDQYRYDIENGLTKTAVLNKGMNISGTAGSAAADISFDFTGAIRTRIEYFASVTSRFIITTGSGGSYLDFTGSGSHNYFIDLPAGADTIRYQVISALAGSWSVVTYYEETP